MVSRSSASSSSADAVVWSQVRSSGKARKSRPKSTFDSLASHVPGVTLARSALDKLQAPPEMPPTPGSIRLLEQKVASFEAGDQESPSFHTARRAAQGVGFLWGAMTELVSDEMKLFKSAALPADVLEEEDSGSSMRYLDDEELGEDEEDEQSSELDHELDAAAKSISFLVNQARELELTK